MKRITKIEQICISCSFPNEAYTNEFKFVISPILKTDILYDYINFSLSQIICLLSNAGPSTYMLDRYPEDDPITNSEIGEKALNVDA